MEELSRLLTHLSTLLEKLNVSKRSLYFILGPKTKEILVARL